MPAFLFALALTQIAVADRDDAVDLLAPYLGLTPLDADDLTEDLLGDTRDPVDPPQHRHPRSTGDAPAWSALLPKLTFSLVYNDLHSTSVGIRSGLIVLVGASFGTAEAPRPLRSPRGLKLVSVEAPEDRTNAQTAVPSVAEVQAAAERTALVRLEDLAGWKTRARAAAWLPTLEADYRRNVGEIDTLGVSSNLGIDSHNLEDVSRYGVRASWQLGQIVFSPEEVTAAQAALDVQQRRQELIAHVTNLYFERLRVLAKLRQAAPHEAEPLQLTAAELTAKLDALTDGFLSQRLQSAAPDATP